MADRLFIDGFEGGNSGLWTSHIYATDAYVVENDDTIYSGSFVTPTVGDYAFYFDGGSSSKLRLSTIQFSDDGTTGITGMYMKFRIQLGSGTTGYTLVTFYNEEDDDIGVLKITSAFTLQYYSAGAIATCPVAIDPYEWTLIEVFIQMSSLGGSDGGVSIRVGGQTSSIITKTSTTTNALESDNLITALEFGTEYSRDYAIDDFVITAYADPVNEDDYTSATTILDNHIGDGYIVGLIPTAAGVEQDWTGTYDLAGVIGSKTSVEAAYLTSEDVGDEFDFKTFSAIPAMETVYSVQVCARVKREGAPDADSVLLYVAPGGTEDNTKATIPLNVGSYFTNHSVWTENPTTEVAWEQGDLTSSLFYAGIKAVDA